MFERIVVPLDGSEIGELALPWAVELASAFGSDLQLITVSGPSDDHNMRQSYIDHKAEITSGSIAARTADQARKATVRSSIMQGDPASRVVEFSETSQASLLILVSHGRSGIMPWPMGSTAARILERCSRPVLFIHAGKVASSSTAALERILVALDGSARGEAVLPFVQELAARLLSAVSLMRVITASYSVATIGGTAPVHVPKMEIQRKHQEASDYLERLKVKFPGPSECIVREGDAVTEILKYAPEAGASVIAITSRGETDSTDWRFGGVAHKLLHSAQRPVLIVKSPAGDA